MCLQVDKLRFTSGRIRIQSAAITIGTAALDHESRLAAMEGQTVVKALIDQIDKVLDRVRREFAKQADGNCSLTGLHDRQRVLLGGIGTGWRRSRLCGGGSRLTRSRLAG